MIAIVLDVPLYLASLPPIPRSGPWRNTGARSALPASSALGSAHPTDPGRPGRLSERRQRFFGVDRPLCVMEWDGNGMRHGATYSETI